MLIRREAYERAGLVRAVIDARFDLAPDEFRVEEGVVAIGPLYGDDAVGDMIEMLEGAGLVYFDDFFELSGGWPDWMSLFVLGR